MFLLIYGHMANTLERAASSLAANISILRKKRSLSQGALAAIAGVPRSTLTYMESGAGNPSLQNLVRVAGALQVTLEELLAAPRPSCTLVRRDDVPSVKRSQGVATVFKLLPDPIPGMEIDRMEIRAGSRMGGVPHLPGTKEYLTVVAGEITVFVAGDKYCVEEGDVFAFPGDQPHSYLNSGTRLAVGVSVVVQAPTGI